MELVCEPIFDYGRSLADWALVDGGRQVADASGAGQTVRLRTSMELGIEANRVRARHVLREGEQLWCALSWAEGLAVPEDLDEANRRLAATTRFWRSWLGRARFPDHRWREPIQRSALAIKGLTYMPTGATVAALTTSLPETPGGERNWDYRYTWMRDTTFTLQALHWLNLDWEADEYMQFVADLEPVDDGSLQIMYGIDGRRDLARARATSSRATPARTRSASAMARSTSARTTSTALCWIRSWSTPRTVRGCRGGCGRSWSRKPPGRWPPGASPIRASGRHAASRAITSPRS